MPRKKNESSTQETEIVAPEQGGNELSEALDNLMENLQNSTHRYSDKISKWKRDEYGLLPDVEYIFTEDSRIDWRAMIKPEYLVVNRQWFTERNQEVPSSIEGLKDNQLLILLAGIKDLARLRGYNSVKHTVQPESDKVTVSTGISWIGNFETNNQPVYFESLGDASVYNVNGIYNNFLASMAENRGFVRAVRNFLGINIAGQDEVAQGLKNRQEEQTQQNSQATQNSVVKSAYEKLAGLLIKEEITFEQLKNRLQKEEIITAEESASITSIELIPSEKILDIIKFTEKRIEERKKAAQAKK